MFLFSGLFCSSLVFGCFELQKTQHQLVKCAKTELLKKQIKIPGDGFSDTVFQFLFLVNLQARGGKQSVALS